MTDRKRRPATTAMLEEEEKTPNQAQLQQNYKLFKEKWRLNNAIVLEIMYIWHYSCGMFVFVRLQLSSVVCIPLW